MTLEILYHDKTEMILRENNMCITIVLNLEHFFNLTRSDLVIGCVWYHSKSQTTDITQGGKLHRILVEVLAPVHLSVE
jgi:hypothetical protein